MIEKVKNKELAGLLLWAGSTMLMGFTIGKLFGWKPEQMIPFNGGTGFPPTLQAGYGLITGDQNKTPFRVGVTGDQDRAGFNQGQRYGENFKIMGKEKAPTQK